MKNRIALALVVALVLPLALFAEGTKEKPINPEVLQVQLIPSRDAAYLDAQRMPLQQMLEAQLKRKVNVTVATDYNALIEGMASKQIHVGLLATTAYVMAADEGAAEAILKSTRYDVDDNGKLLKDKPLVAGYKAQLVAGVDSGIKSVKDLKGKKIAIASFTSTSGFVWPANLLADNGLDPEKDVTWMNVGGHDNAITAVYNGQADAAFTFKDARTLFEKEAFYPDLMKKVVLIANTSEIPNDTISVIPALDPKLKEAVRMAFINMMKDPNGLAIMRKIYNHEGYAPAKDSDYDLVRTYLKRQKQWKF
ncbi:MAG: phosphate/phosphite/phosphonate ABC transporter substrate-binding protein [Treponema sp.]|nr:phosphate/phosphite/phosphonate ABC transporter substrate-binding protein [Treponema sp.]